MILAQIDIVAEALKQVPALSVLCYVVWMFLGKLTLFIDGFRAMQKEHLDSIAGIMKEHLDARAQSREAIKENTQAMQQNTTAITAIVETLDRQDHERRSS